MQDVIEHNLYSAKTPDKINWNIINMLSGKFIIAPAELQNSFLKYIASDNEKKHILFENSNALPKAWFVSEIKSMQSPEDLVLFMNTNEFNPDSVALLTDSNQITENSFSAEGNIKLLEYNPNYIEFDIETESEQFLVLSEIYYPEGWIAKLGDKEIDINQVNHVSRGVNITPGKNKLTLEFIPATYYSSLTYYYN